MQKEQYDNSNFVPPSQRQYSTDALTKGWQIGPCRTEDAIIGKSVFDFLSRNDTAPTSAPTPKLTVGGTMDSRTNGNFTKSRSPMTAESGTPLTSEILVHELKEDHSSPGNGPHKNDDEGTADQLAELLKAFSFKDAEPASEDSGRIMNRFLQLLEKNVELSQHADEEEQSCGNKHNDEITHKDEPGERKIDNKGADVSQHQPTEDEHCESMDAIKVPASLKGKQLCPGAPVFVPSNSPVANNGTEHKSSRNSVDIGSNQLQKQLPFTGQFNQPSDDTPQGYWPAVEIPIPSIPLTYTIWVPAQHPMTDAYLSSATATQEMPCPVPNVGSSTPQPMQGLSASRWANQPPSNTD